MGKNSGPFPRGERDGIYYCWIDGNLRSLRTKKARIAEGRYREMLKEWEEARQVVRRPWTVRQVFDAYLEHIQSCKPNTLRNRKLIFDAFCDEAKVGHLPCRDLTARHLEAWLRTKKWSASWRRSAINFVQAAFNHCLRREKTCGLKENPIQLVQKPPWRRRKQSIAPDDRQKLLDASKGPFRLILEALMETGARPGELCAADIQDYRGGMIVLEEHKEAATGEDRVIYLSSKARELVERAIAGRETGPIFLGSRGQRWTPDTLYCRFKRIKKKLGLGDGVFPYAMRGEWASHAMNDADMNPALIAKQLGHRGLEVLMRHYLRENPEAMREALDQANQRVRTPASPDPETPSSPPPKS